MARERLQSQPRALDFYRYNDARWPARLHAFSQTSLLIVRSGNTSISAFTRLTSSFAIRTRACDSTWTSLGSVWWAMSVWDRGSAGWRLPGRTAALGFRWSHPSP